MADRLKWLHTLALHLDDVLALPQLTQPCLLGDLEDKPLSAAACFQALLAQGLQPECAQVRCASVWVCGVWLRRCCVRCVGLPCLLGVSHQMVICLCHQHRPLCVLCGP